MSKRQAPTRPDYIKWLLLAGAAALVVLLGAYCFWHHVLPHSVNVDRYRYPVAGIDVSKHNGDIDFDQVRDDDYQFVFIKASEGKTYKDAAFDRNYREALQAGLKVGKTSDLPLVIDLEDDWGNGATVSRQTAIERVVQMIDILNRAGYQVMIYTNLDGYEKYYKDNLLGCDLWLCSFTSPDMLPEHPHRIQQFSHEGTVAGVKGDVDLNVFRGSKREWAIYLDDVKQP